MDVFSVTQRNIILWLLALFVGGVMLQWLHKQCPVLWREHCSVARLRSEGAADGFMLSPPSEPSAGTQAPLSVDINRAEAAQLMLLPGIGPVLAERIVTYRKQHGHFSSADDLRGVSGIGEKKIERLRPYVAAVIVDTAANAAGENN